ncbi:MAG: bifunctional phosphoglucose/phosphomannose isomerase [Candidatus Omnitrophota bacterium]
MRKSKPTEDSIKKLDKSDMLGLLMDFPAQCKAAKEIAQQARISFEKRDFNKVIFAGLGGSAIGADLVRSYLYFEAKLPITVYREYDLPASLDNFSLVFILSYSGNTEETLSAYEQAKQKGSSIITVSSGGKLKEWAKRDNVVFIEIPQGLPPRCALGYLSIIPLCILARLGLIKDMQQDINQAIALLEDLRNKSLNPKIGQKDNVSKILAAKIFNKIPVIYSGSVHFDVTATRFRCQLNENSKALAASHLFPEMNHNEIVGWQNPKKLFKGLVVLMLRDKGMHPRVATRLDITRDMLTKEHISVIEVWSRGEGLLSRILSLIYVGDFASYYLAILYGIDPTPVDRVTYLKKELARK